MQVKICRNAFCAFFPNPLLEVYVSVKEFQLVELGGKVMGVVTVIISVYMAAYVQSHISLAAFVVYAARDIWTAVLRA